MLKRADTDDDGTIDTKELNSQVGLRAAPPVEAI
jgi:hypothetical protein